MINHPIPSRMRRIFNAWTKGVLLGQKFESVLNLGCGHDIDREGGHYSNYFGTAEVVRVDCAEETSYNVNETVYLSLYSLGIVSKREGEPYLVVKNPLDRIAKAESLPFKNKEFDCVFVNWALHDMDRVKALFEINRVLKLHGRVFISYCRPPELFMLETRSMIEQFFEVGTFMRLSLEEYLDGRCGSAEAIFGIKC